MSAPTGHAHGLRELPAGLVANPRLAQWVAIGEDTVEVRAGKIEVGQGILTALAQIAAEELDVRVDQVRIVPATTAIGPDQGVTSGSRSIQEAEALRVACAEVRALFMEAAAGRLACRAEDLAVHDGDIIGPDGRATSYWQLREIVDLDRDATGQAAAKPTARHGIVGTNVARLDLPDKITGRPRFVQDLRLPGQVYGRVVRPPSRAATLLNVDLDAVRQLPGVLSVVRNGSFLGVVAEGEDQADAAAARLAEAATWQDEESLPDIDAIEQFLRSGPVDTSVVEEPAEPSGAGVATHRATYFRPFLAHASIAPSSAAALWEGDTLQVWSHSQGIHPLRRAIALALALDPGRITIRHVESAGCYGHNGADDAAFDAVLLARSIPGRPVHLRWTRQDELVWAPFGPSMVVDLSASVDAGGDVVDWDCEVWSNGHTSRPGYAGSPGLLAAAHLAEPIVLPPAMDPAAQRGGGTLRNARPIYSFPHHRLVGHRVLRMPIRTSALRSLGSFSNVFAIESFMDELAAAAGADPIEYRLRQLRDRRARHVLETVAAASNWATRNAVENVGYGVGLAQYKNRAAYCAVVAEVEADHDVRVRRLVVAVDAGHIVNPDGLCNQIEGGAIQATSWTLKEQVRFDRRTVTSADWESYPILRFSEAPLVDVHLVPRPDEPSLGVGEAAQGPTAAAIGNAVSNALGIRVRRLPLTPENIIAAMPD